MYVYNIRILALPVMAVAQEIDHTASLHERLVSEDETNSGDAWLELSLPNICWN